MTPSARIAADPGPDTTATVHVQAFRRIGQRARIASPLRRRHRRRSSNDGCATPATTNVKPRRDTGPNTRNGACAAGNQSVRARSPPWSLPATDQHGRMDKPPPSQRTEQARTSK